MKKRNYEIGSPGPVSNAIFAVLVLAGMAVLCFWNGCSKVRAIEFTVVATHSPAGPYCAFPGVCRLPDGQLCAVFYAGTGHVTWNDEREKAGAVAYTLSEDDGKTWSEAGILLDTDKDDRDPNISVLRDGRIILAYFQLLADDRKGGLRGDGVYIAEVKPGPTLAATGKTVGLICGTPRKVQHDAGGGGPLRDFGDGLLMMGTYHLDQPYVVRSGDNGKSWQVFAIPNGGKHLDAETDVIEIQTGGDVDSDTWQFGSPNPDQVKTTKPRVGGPKNDSRGGEVLAVKRELAVRRGINGSLVKGSNPKTGGNPESVQFRPTRLFYAIMRGHKCNGHYSTSVDGKNWTVAKDIGFPLDCPELHRVELGGKVPGTDSPMPKAAADDTPSGLDRPHSAILLAHRLPATAMHYSLDECKTWIGPITVDSCGGAYPAFVTCKDGSVLIVYYVEGKLSDIRCRRFTITRKGIAWLPPAK